MTQVTQTFIAYLRCDAALTALFETLTRRWTWRTFETYVDLNPALDSPVGRRQNSWTICWPIKARLPPSRPFALWALFSYSFRPMQPLTSIRLEMAFGRLASSLRARAVRIHRRLLARHRCEICDLFSPQEG